MDPGSTSTTYEIPGEATLKRRRFVAAVLLLPMLPAALGITLVLSVGMFFLVVQAWFSVVRELWARSPDPDRYRRHRAEGFGITEAIWVHTAPVSDPPAKQ